MPYTVRNFSKKEVEQTKKELAEKIESLSGIEWEKTRKFIKEMSELKQQKKISRDEYLVILRAKILKDEACKKAINEVMMQNQLEFDLENSVQEFLKTKELPKTSSEERVKVLENANTLFLDRKRMLITEKEGSDPDPKFLGKSEDGKFDIYEVYVKCRECHKVFKSFKGNQAQIFCSSKCRQDWFSKHMRVLNEIEDKIEAEKNAETFEWERIGSKSDKHLGTYGIFRKVFKND